MPFILLFISLQFAFAEPTQRVLECRVVVSGPKVHAREAFTRCRFEFNPKLDLLTIRKPCFVLYGTYSLVMDAVDLRESKEAHARTTPYLDISIVENVKGIGDYNPPKTIEKWSFALDPINLLRNRVVAHEYRDIEWDNQKFTQQNIECKVLKD